MRLAKLADSLASRADAPSDDDVYASDGWGRLHDWVDLRTASDLPTARLDILTNMVAARLRRAARA